MKVSGVEMKDTSIVILWRVLIIFHGGILYYFYFVCHCVGWKRQL